MVLYPEHKPVETQVHGGGDILQILQFATLWTLTPTNYPALHVMYIQVENMPKPLWSVIGLHAAVLPLFPAQILELTSCQDHTLDFHGQFVGPLF